MFDEVPSPSHLAKFAFTLFKGLAHGGLDLQPTAHHEEAQGQWAPCRMSERSRQ